MNSINTDTPLELEGLKNRSVGEIVSDNPNLSRVFQAFSIEFCCQGKRTLAEVCQQKKVDPEMIISAIQIELESQKGESVSPEKLSLDEMIDHIQSYHNHIKMEIPRIHAMAERVATVHGHHTPSLFEVYQVFLELREELLTHLDEEEKNLLPIINSIKSKQEDSSLEDPIHFRMIEHDEILSYLERLRKLTNQFTPPESACNTYRALFAGLEELDFNITQQVGLENNFLFLRTQSKTSEQR